MPLSASGNSSKSNKVFPLTIPASKESTLLLKANLNRKGATIWNECNATLFIEFALNASLTVFTLKITPGSYYELPFDYTGPVAGIWDGEDKGSALVREFV